ncbi:MAG: DUF2970 domain-containing protein [Betaproteobacteria bacterium]|nr:DUF2970 domain-containing protein [Betaproteobacteria bacterium]
MFAAIKAVLWAFLGIRSQEGYDQDRARLTPRQIIAAGLVLTGCFVVALFVLVRILTAK